MIGSYPSAAHAAAAPAPDATDGSADPRAPGFDGAAPPECVGPLAIPPAVTRGLRALAAEAGADDVVPLSLCAIVLVGRLSRGLPWRACVIHNARMTVTPAVSGPADPALSFRAALRLAARQSTPPDPPDAGPVAVTILVSDDGERLYVETMTNAADAPLAQCWARTYLCLLTGMVDRPDAPMAAHPLIDGAERERILLHLNAYLPPQVRHRTMAGPFQEQVERTPDAVALVDEEGCTVSYRELDQRANRLAHFLVDNGAGPGARIGVCLDRGIDQIIAIYAAVKTGAGYVPIDADLPDARLAYLLENAAPRYVLTAPSCRPRIPVGAWQVLDVESDRASWRGYPTMEPTVGGSPSALLHILYTSGTTGRPKGVAYPTDGALAHLAWMQSRYPYGPGDYALFKTSPGFDVSIWEIFWPLYHGARLVICRPGGHRDARHLAHLVEAYGVTTAFLPPTVMAPFLEKVSGERAGALRWVLCGGEPITPRIRDTFYATLPGATLVNCYGPTEAGSVTDMALKPDPGAPVPLGRPAANFRLTVLDENLDLVPVGLAGEAYISASTGLAHGYWRAPARTAERFVPDPYGPPGARMYRTGDLCRYRDDGVLEHLGRIDRQIKVRGLRIEPGEIESVLAAHPTVADCAVIAHGDPVRLLAFAVPADSMSTVDLDVAAIGDHAAASLPEHMRPERVVPVPAIPATVNGKIDKDALLATWRALTERERAVVPPADELEASLVEIYSRVLDTTPVSVLDTFAQLGGHSLLAFRLLDECTERLRAQPNVTELLTGTLRDVAASMRASATPPAGGSGMRASGTPPP